MRVVEGSREVKRERRKSSSTTRGAGGGRLRALRRRRLPRVPPRADPFGRRRGRRVGAARCARARPPLGHGPRRPRSTPTASSSRCPTARSRPRSASPSSSEMIAATAMGLLALVPLALLAPALGEARSRRRRGPAPAGHRGRRPRRRGALVAAHVAHGWALDLGARRSGARGATTRALRFGLYAAGWDLVIGPLGAVVVAAKEGVQGLALHRERRHGPAGSKRARVPAWLLPPRRRPRRSPPCARRTSPRSSPPRSARSIVIGALVSLLLL